MSTTITDISQSKVLSKLDTYNYVAALTSMYVVDVQMSEIPASSLQIEIKLNGSQKAITVAPAASQSILDLRVVLNCTANDTIAVIVSSTAAGDKQLNSVKGILKITPGSV